MNKHRILGIAIALVFGVVAGGEVGWAADKKDNLPKNPEPEKTTVKKAPNQSTSGAKRDTFKDANQNGVNDRGETRVRRTLSPAKSSTIKPKQPEPKPKPKAEKPKSPPARY